MVSGPDDGNKPYAEWLANAFKSVDWLIPAYLPMGLLSNIAKAIYASQEDEKVTVLRFILSTMYSPQYMATFYLERYSKINHIKDFSPHIGEAIQAYHAGYRHVAITAMIPVIEGIVRKIASAAGRDVGTGTSGMSKEFDAIVERELASPNCFGERLVMFELLRDYMRDRFLKSISRFDGLNQFNRHGILHGVFDDYGEELNFLRIITLLDLLCFIIGWRWGGVSVFAPEDTEASRDLASRYLKLQPAGTSLTIVPRGIMEMLLRTQ